MRYALVFDFGGVIMKTVTHAPRWAWDERLGLERGSIERTVSHNDSWRPHRPGATTSDTGKMCATLHTHRRFQQLDQILQRDHSTGDIPSSGAQNQEKNRLLNKKTVHGAN